MEFDPEKYHLKSSSFFDSLPADEARLVKECLQRKEYKKGQVLFREGSLPKGIYIVRKGKIKIYQTNGDGKESIVYIYRKGDYFGYRPLLGGEPHPVSAAAMDNAVVSFIYADEFNKLLARSNQFAKQLLINLSKEFSVWINKLSAFSAYSVKERVAISLLIFNQVYRIDNDSSKQVVISINHNDFASFVGTAKENLVRILRVFKDEKIVSSRRTSIVLLKAEALQELLKGI
ncbi:MAG: Crp/Fnr family transcriptional regulator [Bacteroidia bacterium]